MKKHETKAKDPEKVDQAKASEAEAPEEETENPLQKELDEAIANRDEYLKLAQLARAEFDNYRRRNQNVRADALTEGAAETITALLPVLDNLERAVAAGGEDSYAEGVAMVLRQFTDCLKSLGVTEIPCESGAAFDPNLHNAVLNGPADEEHPEGTILTVLQKGYEYKSRILRHSMVQVAQ